MLEFRRVGTFVWGQGCEKQALALLELTSSLEEATDARCLFGRGPDVPFDLKVPHWAVSSMNSPRNTSGGESMDVVGLETKKLSNQQRSVRSEAMTPANYTIRNQVLDGFELRRAIGLAQ